MVRSIKKKSRASRPPGATSPSYVMEDQVGFLMRVAMQRHTSIFMSLMIGELTQMQFAALAKLLEVGTCSQNQLGRLIYLDAATIKGVVDRLRARKLIEIESNPHDLRRSMVALTKLGTRMATEGVTVAHRITAETLVPLNQAERRQIARLLKKLM